MYSDIKTNMKCIISMSKTLTKTNKNIISIFSIDNLQLLFLQF